MGWCPFFSLSVSNGAQLLFFFFFSLRLLYLVLGYADGFQVWDCSNIEEMREVLSVRDGATRCARILEFPADDVADASLDSYERFEATRPHLAVV